MVTTVRRKGDSQIRNIVADTTEEWESAASSKLRRAEIAQSLTLTTEHLFGWKAAPHHVIWADAITRLFRREIPGNRLLIVAPPAHAKTNWAGVAAPAWYVGAINQDHHILYLSSAQGQSIKSSIAVRDTIGVNRRWRELYPTVLPDKDKGWAAARWFVRRPDHPGDKDPTMMAAGVGSQLVLGSRGDLIEFDDINTMENTATAYRRDKVKEWVRTTAFSRETRDAVQLSIMTRWHTDDIAQFFEKEGGYEVIVMPALGYWENPGGKGDIELGTPLWEEEHDRDDLAKKQRDLGPYKFQGMYQGDPIPDGGQLFRESFWKPFYVPFSSPVAKKVLTTRKRALKPPYNAVVNHLLESVVLTQQVLTVDTAFKESDGSDYTAMALWGIGIDRQAYLLAMFRRQLAANKLYGAFIAMWRRYRPDIAVIEDRASGIQLIQDIQQKQAIPVATYPATANKEERAKGQAHVLEGAAHLPDPDQYYVLDPNGVRRYYDDPTEDGETPEQWILDFITEHGEFPLSRNDDMVDTSVMFAEWARGLLDWWTHEPEDATLELPGQVMGGGATRFPERSAALITVGAGDESVLLTGLNDGWAGEGGREGWPGR